MNFKKLLAKYFGGSTRSRRPIVRNPMRLCLDRLEDRITPTTVDLFTTGASGTINGAQFEEVIAGSSTGTGIFQSFVRIDRNGTEQGVNYDRAGGLSPQYDEGNTPSFNRKLLLSEVPIVNVGGIDYREIFLDNNQNDGTGPYLSLDKLMLSIASAGNLQQAAPPAYDPTFGGAATLVYNLDAGTDSVVRMLASNALDNGSGRGDVRVLIPNSLFAAAPPSGTFVYLFSAFGNAPAANVDGVPGNETFTSNGGFEEWAVRKAASFTVAKSATVLDSITPDVPDADGVVDSVNDFIKYTITVTNTGNVELTSPSIVDPLLGGSLGSPTSGDTDLDGRLDAGEIWQFIRYYDVTQSDINNGVDVPGVECDEPGDVHIENQVTADFADVEQQTADACVPVDQIAAIAVDKVFVNVTGGNGNAVADAAGDVLNYTVTVTNTGNVTLTGVTVVDPLTGQNISGVTLTPGASQTYNTSYILTQADLNNQGGGDGDIDNTATADSNETGSVSDSVQVPLVYNPAIAIDKVFVNVTGGDGDILADAAGDVLNYTVTVTNTGNITLTNVTVVDPLTGQNISGGTLAPGASQSFNTTYTLTQADLDRAGNAGPDGDIDNTATADSNETGSVSDSEEVPLVYNPAIAIDKVFVNVSGGNGNTVADAAGDLLNYTVTVTNTGNVTLTNVTVVDPLTGQNISGVTLAPGDSQTYNTSYTLTQDDLNNNGGGDGDIDNTATADSNETNSVSDSETVPLGVTPRLSIDKVFVNITGGNGNTVADAAGDVLNYTVTVSNTGNVTLTNVTVVDPLTGQNISGVTLAPGDSQSYNTSYILTQADLDNNGGGDGDVDNTATADSDQTGPVSDSAQVPVVYNPRLAIDKVFVNITGGNGNTVADVPGDVLNYTVTVTNTGNVTLTNVTVVDPLTGQNISGVTLAPGDSQTFNTSYILTQADLDNNGGGDGDVDNTATADSNETGPTSDSEQVPVVYAPGLAIDKVFVNVTGGNGNALADAAGDVLNYTVTITNTGNITLTGVTVIDPLTGQNVSSVTLAPGTSQTFNTSYTLAQSDLDNQGGGDGDIDNTAIADSNETPQVDDSETVPLEYNPAIAINKVFVNVTSGNGNALADTAGDVLNYTVTVSNTGNITLTNVTVVDPLTGQSISGVTLAPGASQLYNTSYTLTQADLDRAGNAGPDGDIDNTATADSNETDSVSDSETVPLVYNPTLAIDKVFANVTGGDGDDLADAAGDVLNYTVAVTNTGNVTLTGVTVVDPLTGQNISGVTLAPGETQTFNTSYTLTQADLDRAGNAGSDGDIDNTATADSNETPPTDDTEEVPLVYNPALAIDKVFINVTGGNGNDLADAVGDVLNYTVTVSNTGNVTLTGVTVVDPLTGQNISSVTLAPGETQSFNTSYTLTQADIDGAGNAGSDNDIDNTATADSNETPPTDDTEEVPLVYNPALAIDKVFINVTGGNGNDLADAVGDVLNYTVTVSNTGNVTLTGVTVTDPLTGQNISSVTLAPGDSQTFNTSYTLTQDDLDGAGNAGSDNDIDNTATADSNETPPTDDTETVPVTHNPSISLDKIGALNLGNNSESDPGDIINYTFTVTNTGNVTLFSVTLTDLASGVTVGPLTDNAQNGVDVLAPGDVETATGTYAITQLDIDAGMKFNNAEVAGFSAQEVRVSAEDSHLEPIPAPAPPRQLGTLSGTVFLDLNNNGRKDKREKGIAGVTIELKALVNGVLTTVATTKTNRQGKYTFSNLAAGVYRVFERQPRGLRDGREQLGRVNGKLAGLIEANDRFFVSLLSSARGEDYNFGERVSKTRFI